MNTLPKLTSLALASLLIAPACAETYGEAVADTTARPDNVRTVPRSTTANATPPSPGTTFHAAISAPVADTKAGRWQLIAGHLVRQDLTNWGKESGWQVLWHLPRDWTVPADTAFDGDFKEAASAVIRTLAENGLVIRGQFYDGNRTLIVSGAGPVVLDPQ